ncbi:uncharacterized protein LOC118803955 [Colossoma macropomum]|uniref:uncharacterized protein LOC118803955 n=1 Tax=Colossoma macropomum TaxID=42526 RepID=UPI0018655A04|nr:uncharacterized protein LOC118803955 [Colossoma macropomum]
MLTCRPGHYVLLLLLFMFSAVSESAVPQVKVNLHDSATLSCSERCSGLVRWTVFHKRSDTLAECDQTSCRSKEGYQMIHDQYLKGNLSLTITDADFSKKTSYTCDCDGKDLCGVALDIEPLNTTVQVESGESLFLDLDVSDPVEVIYTSTDAAGPSSGQICTVNKSSLQCEPEYTQRASAALKLSGMKKSDSGVYTIRDTRSKEIIRNYSVTVKGDSEAQKQNHRLSESCCSAPSDAQPPAHKDQGAAVPAWMIAVLVVMVAALIACAVLAVACVRLRRKNQLLQMRSGRSGDDNHNQNGIPMNGLANHNPEEQQRFSSDGLDQV